MLAFAYVLAGCAAGFAAGTAKSEGGIYPFIINPIAVGSATDGSGGFTQLKGARGGATFEVNGSPYAVVASRVDNGIQIVDLSDPVENPIAVGSATDGSGGFTGGANSSTHSSETA